MPEVSWLNEALDRVRLLAGEPAVNANYSDDELIRHMLLPGASIVYNELFMATDSPPLLEFSVTLSNATRYYRLPPIVRHITRFRRYNDKLQLLADWVPRNDKAWYGPGWTIHNAGGDLHIELRPDFWKTSSETWVIEYFPSGDFLFHEGDGQDGGDTDNKTFVLDATPTRGRLDKRQNAYAGSVLRILDGTEHQDRLIEAYEPQTRTITVRNAFDPVLGTGDIQYEIAPPPASPLWYHAVAYSGYLDMIAAKSGTSAEYQMVRMRYNSAMKALRNTFSNVQLRRPTHFERDTVDNPDARPAWWGGW